MSEISASGFGARPPQGRKSAEIYFQIIDAIVSHRMGPGTKLSEEEIGTAFNVSRTIVRGALQALAHDGLVTIEPNRGAFVARPSFEEGRQVFHARAIIEPEVAALAAQSAGNVLGEKLQFHLQLEADALANADHRRAIWLSGRFHLIIAEAAGQPVLKQILSDLIGRSSLIIALYWRDERATCDGHDHAALANAIESGDAETARAEMSAHLVHIETNLSETPTAKPVETVLEILSGQSNR